MKSFLIFLLISSVVFSQSIHQEESEYYKSNKANLQKSGYSGENNNKILDGTQELTKIVFGFLPWWEKLSGADANIRFDLLTHLAVFSFEADSLGNINTPPYSSWPWYSVFNNAIDNKVKLIMTITNFNSNDVHGLLTDNGKRNKLVFNIAKELVTTGLSGVIIDFENVKPGDDRQYAYKNFMSNLRTELHNYNPEWEIGAALPPIAFGSWDFKGIAEYCDYIFVMCYDFYGRFSSTTGPSSPLTGGNYNITTAFDSYYKDVPPEKLIMGIPYYGNKWLTKSGEPYTSVSPYDSSKQFNNWLRSPYYKDIIPDFFTVERVFDQSSQTPWLRWLENDSTWLQLWYDDSSSIANKYDFAIQKNLGGVGIWALGYDDGRSELWNLIKDKFTTTTGIAESPGEIPYMYKLEQNYPNPFNPSTIIRFNIQVGAHVTLKIYDILGRVVAILVNEDKVPGSYEIKFDGSSLASGTYFFRLTADDFSDTRKMTLIK